VLALLGAASNRSVAAAAAGSGAAKLYVSEALGPYAGLLSERPLLAASGGFGTSLVVEIPAIRSDVQPQVSTIEIAAPLRDFRGEGDVDFGLRALARAARLLAELPAAAPVRIAFLADEGSALPEGLRAHMHDGLQDAADALDEPSRALFLYVDLSREPSRPRLEYGTDDGIAPRYLVETLLESFELRGLRLPLAVPYTELYRLKLVAGRTELRLLRERRIPAALFADEARGANPGGAGPSVSAEDFAAVLAASARRLAEAEPLDDERYALFPTSAAPIVLPEAASVAVFIAAWGLLLLVFLGYSVTHRQLLVARWNVFLKRLWIVAGFLAALAGCFVLAGWTLSLLLKAFGAESAAASYATAALKLFLAYAYYYAFTPLIFFRAPRRAHFYGSAAVMLLALGALTAAVLDFTFVPVYVWAGSFAFIASMIVSPTPALVPTILAPLQILGSAAAAIGSGDAGAARAIMDGGLGIDLYLALLSLPFMFLFRRIPILSRAQTIRKKGKAFSAGAYRIYTRPILVAGALAAAAVFASRSADAERHRPRPVRETGVDSARFSVSSSSSAFLESRTVRLRFESAIPPDRIDLTLVSADKLSVYDAPVPFDLSEDGRTAVFRLGEKPPTPLRLEITLAKDAAARFEAGALYYDAKTDRALTLRASSEVAPEARP